MPAQLDPGDDKQFLSRQYTDAVAAAGGVPLIFPLLEPAESFRAQAERLDGILLTGNHSDVDPALYNAIRLDSCGPSEPLREKMDFFLLEIAFERKIPVLAVCFGIQSLNVFLGGSLIQDIDSNINTVIRHSNSESGGRPSHEIEILAGSILEPIAGGLKAAVNSTHHQALARLGRGIEVIARAPDGVIESVECANPNHWILGVQWHPEKSFAYDDFSRKIFECFLARCRAARGFDERTHT